MSFVDNYSSEEIKEMSMIEIAFEVMRENKEPFRFNDLMKRVAEIKGMSEDEVKDRISFLYTDLNVDGRFICLGNTNWGLRSWYPYEQGEEDITTGKSKKKKKKKVDDDDDFDDEFLDDDDDFADEDDEFEDLEDELDEIANDDDSDHDDDDDSEFDLEEDEEFEETEEEDFNDDLDENK